MVKKKTKAKAVTKKVVVSETEDPMKNEKVAEIVTPSVIPIGEKAVKTKKKKVAPPTLKIVNERDIAADFATKIYDKFDQIIKSVILFGSSAKKVATVSSDIDIIVIIDDVSVKWDEELIAWYREELGKLIKLNPYSKALHINTVKLTTWWDDMMRGDPVVINVLRYGDALIDFGGFFNPLRILLKEGKIKSTPESIYTLLQRAPAHMTRARQSMLAVVDGLYWTMVDAAHAALISADIQPSSPEAIPEVLDKHFVQTKQLNKRFVVYYAEIHKVAKEIIHGAKTSVKGRELDDWFLKADAFLGEMAKLVDTFIERKSEEEK
jgi:predicted nucleotidyltransferase/uncharacterized protein (UPF0332 family)